MKLVFELDDKTGRVISICDEDGRPVPIGLLPGGRLAYMGIETHIQGNESWEHKSSRNGRKNAVIFDSLSGLRRSFPPNAFENTYKREIVTLLCLEIKREER